ncbi:superoxide dismutase [Sediminibacterium sp.]|uniref:superoxide dismutase n=1 Tax=Sediminibacterium sp. TaxID=1917865 RepID=UPI002720D420|nr:superoxide dismutase [Sediminibacterium sp.]MDO9000611.1 superoxide dismutase [Bacteroidota bacterium]MDP3146821.1 superoxide dismutase [Bacteroidota bacterium]MDP3567633.1 superoxide dismutase [Sediminibacterium sp.]
MGDNRRDFLKKGALLGLAGIAKGLVGENKINQLESISANLEEKDKFTLLPLPYSYNALEPYIDAQTMEIHYSKHHQGYVNNLNKIVSTNIDYLSSDEIKCTHVDKFTSPAVRNNLGGHFNHTLFWTLLKPNPKGEANLPTGKIAEAIKKEFKSFDDFKKDFSEKAGKIFGSGWCWLVVQDGKLKIITTPNQDNPLMKVQQENEDLFAPQKKPILALDIWEHAYYLKHQNKRADYIANWWNIVNWEMVEKLFNSK